MSAWVLTLAAVLLRPLARGGYLLGHDMVFTPEQPLTRDSVGLGTAAPRAVPLDALVALAERVLDGAVVGRLALALPLLAAGLGAAAVVRRAGLVARLAAASAAVWNPFVVERLAIGQWALLWCYAALPWLVIAMSTTGRRWRWPGRGLALAAASITPTGGVVAFVSTVTLAATGRQPRREIIASTALALAAQLPWVVPAVVSPASSTSDPAGVAAFAARAEHPGGVLLSLLGGGGIWDADVVPASRDGARPWLWLLLLAVAAVYGWRPLRERLGGRLVDALAGLAAAGLLVALLPALPGGASLTRGLIAHVPGAGLLRDAQKWLIPLVLLEALLLGAAAGRLAARVGSARAVLAVAAAVLPAVLLPDAAATLRPVLTPVHYPADWKLVAARLTGPGDVAVLPWGSYRTFPWAPGRTVLDPAPRLLPRPVVVDDRLAVGARVLRGEDPRAARIGAALAAGGPSLGRRLADQGVGWVVVEHRTPGTPADLSALPTVHAGPDVSLYRVPGRVRHVGPSAGRTAAVAVADGGAALVLVAALAGPAIGRRTRRSARRKARRGEGPSLL